MARQIWVNRQEAEALVTLLEHEYRAGRQPGRLADYAAELREAFGMTEQPSMTFGEDRSLPPCVAWECERERRLDREQSDQQKGRDRFHIKPSPAREDE